MNNNNSINEFNRATKVIPGGVNSPVRAFKSVKKDPVYISHGLGSKVYDIDDNEYIDFVSSWGPLIFGHAHSQVVEAIKASAEKGTSYGAPTIIETELAELICKMVPSIEIVRMVNSGTEATMSALRLARGYTGRDKVIKFAGNYHGHADSFLIKAGSGAMTLGVPDSPGVTAGTAKDTLTATYNDLDTVKQLFEQNKNEIAAIILEPVAGNMGVVLPQEGFLKGLRDLCDQHGTLLIFDEVITGFRLSKGGAQAYFGIIPDLTTLGKIIGGGLPVGAYGGKKEIMEQLAPAGAIYQAGTLSGNPLAMNAGFTMLSMLNDTEGLYDELARKGKKLADGIRRNLKEAGVSGVVNQIGSMLTVFFTESEKVSSFDEAMSCDTDKYAKYFGLALENGIYLAPSQFECAFASYVMSDEEIDYALDKNLEALKSL
ncbi:glutamate-1-semialdehyde 2,1-aminomutase [Bacteroidales bacterium]|nr:glutamate-1-semialdehyde 2,1-aminomutase [Bacteroidales bacterium]